MTVVFYCNYLNHHQVFVADELFRLLGDDYHFVATLPRNGKYLKGGVDYSTRPYCILAGESEEARDEGMRLAVEADVCVFGAFSQEYAVTRAVKTPKGLSFEMAERWLKRGWLNIISPHFIRWRLNYTRYYRKANFRKLCMSAYAAGDDRKVGAYRGRHYRWGYFTDVEKENGVEASTDVSTSNITPLMWCSRYLMWKHPELPVLMAERLKKKGHRFVLDMYGSGEQEEAAKQLAERLGVQDVVRFHGALPNAGILEAMRWHEVFLFTSDRMEGWGAVANESMANGCVLVTSDAIGSAPYLVREGHNGFLFRSGDVEDLTAKVEWLITHPQERHAMQRHAYAMMRDVWSPWNAAGCFLRLVDTLQNGRDAAVPEGPCSKAPYL